MYKTSLIMLILSTLTYASNSQAKLEMSCDIGNESACIKLQEYLTSKNKTVKVSPKKTSTVLSPKSVNSNTKNISCISAPMNLFIWKSYGISSSEARDWSCIGVDRRDAREWRDRGFMTANEVNVWLQLNVDLKTFDKLQRLGIRNPEEVKQWIDAGVSASQIQYWYEKGITTSTEAKKWIEVDISRSLATEWKKLGFSVDEIHKWYSAGFRDKYVIKEWKKAGILPTEASKWKKFGLNASGAKNWIDSGITSTTQAKEWAAIGLKDNVTIGKWEKSSLDTPGKANKWIKAGFDDGYLWKTTGFSIEEAKIWRVEGIREGYKYRNEGIQTLAQAVTAQTCRQAMTFTVFNNRDKGVLYGKIIQSLPHGYIISANSRELFFVPTFDNKLRTDNNYIAWFVESRGERYRYNSVGRGMIQAARVHYIGKDDVCSKYLKYLEESKY